MVVLFFLKCPFLPCVTLPQLRPRHLAPGLWHWQRWWSSPPPWAGQQVSSLGAMLWSHCSLPRDLQWSSVSWIKVGRLCSAFYNLVPACVSLVSYFKSLLQQTCSSFPLFEHIDIFEHLWFAQLLGIVELLFPSALIFQHSTDLTSSLVFLPVGVSPHTSGCDFPSSE